MDGIDLYGNDHKLGDFGEPDFKDLLDQDVFSDTPSVTRSPMEEYSMEPSMPMDHDWLDSFFEDPVLNDRMISDALQPPSVKSEHSYSLANGNTGIDSSDSLKNRQEKDMDCELMTTTKPSQQVTLNRNTLSLIKDEPLDLSMNDLECAAATANLIKTINPDQLTCTTTSLAATTTATHTILKQPPTIILATTSKQSVLNTSVTRTQNERSLILSPQVNIKMEAPSPEAYASSPEHSVTYESIGLPPTPPSSSNSDSEGGLSPQRSAPPSPQRTTPLYRQQAIRASMAAQSSAALFSQPIPTSGILVLSEEEKRTLISEGYPIPHKLPLTKQEEKNLKKVRRKIKNKISAQESRRKKKEYLETLEKRVEAFSQENNDLKKKVDNLETNNRSLMSQLQKLQAIVGKVTRPTTSQAGTCLMVLTLFFAVFVGTWSPLTTLSVGYISQSQMAMGPSHASAPHIQQPQNLVKVMGPEVKDARIDTYDTPNMRSRVLLSIKEELEDQEPYGPHTPLSYRDLFSCFWSSVASDKVPSSSGGGTDKGAAVEPPMPEVLKVEEPVVTATSNHSEEDSRVYQQATMHPDMEAKVSTNLLAGDKQTLETAA